MRLIVDIPADVLDKAKKLIAEGKYSDLEAFVLAALHNQVSLEDRPMGELRALLKKGPRTIAAEPGAARPPAGPMADNLTMLDASGYSDVTAVDVVSPDALPAGPVWGQYNRIFPVKLALRVLANSLKGKGPLIPLEPFQEVAASLAKRIGLELRDIDREKSRGRGEKLSTGLPVGENAFKSELRFKNQFIGYLDKKGHLMGFPGRLRFISITNDRDPMIGLTKPGLAFAKLTNPILDEDRTSDSALSDEETQFYLTHVFTRDIKEIKAMLLVLKSIEEGYNRPDKLTEIVSSLNDRWTKPQANTIRSGLVGRMGELGLISRKRLGTREVAYELTGRGKNLLPDRSTA